MIIGVLKEPTPETRVSLLPEHILALKKMNVSVYLESGAGVQAFANNEKYEEAGATVMARSEILQKADLLLSINNPSSLDVDHLRGKILFGLYHYRFMI